MIPRRDGEYGAEREEPTSLFKPVTASNKLLYELGFGHLGVLSCRYNTPLCDGQRRSEERHWKAIRGCGRATKRRKTTTTTVATTTTTTTGMETVSTTVTTTVIMILRLQIVRATCHKHVVARYIHRACKGL